MIYTYLWDQFNPSGYYNRMGFYKTKLELDFILQHVNTNKKVILDIGGGSGRFAVPLIQKGHEVTVVDLNAEAIRLCKERGVKNAYCKDIRELPPEKYDVVTAIELFLVTSPAEVFNTAHNQLKDNGIFIFVGTNKLSWRNKLHNLRKGKSKNLGELTIKEYFELLRSSKFEAIDIRGFNWMPFRVNSNNMLIPFFALIEKSLKLGSWLTQSPWLLFACRKIES
jgi:SAM-dependent methyltransferase